MRSGDGQPLIDELMTALTYDKSLIDGRGVARPDLLAPPVPTVAGGEPGAAACRESGGPSRGGAAAGGEATS